MPAINSTRSEYETDVYDSDPEPNESNSQLYWRLNPDISLSDWTIIIRTTVCNDDDSVTECSLSDQSDQDRDGDDGSRPETRQVRKVKSSDTARSQDLKTKPSKIIKEDVYHVHKHILAVGNRRSKYFSDLFGSLSGGSRNVAYEDCISIFALEEIAARAIPQMLDFMYSPDGNLDLCTGNVTAIHWLGQYFEIKRLRFEAKTFLQKDLSTATCGTYYEQAKILKDEKMMKYVSKFCIKNIEQINPDSRLVHVPEPNFWLRILRHYTITSEFSRHMSQLITAFCLHNQVEADIFTELTDEACLPVIAGDCALSLIDLERAIVSPDPSTLTTLQTRCIKALVQAPEGSTLLDDVHMSVLQKQSQLVLSTILVESIKRTKIEKELDAKPEDEDFMSSCSRWKFLPHMQAKTSCSPEGIEGNIPKFQWFNM